MVMVVGFMMTRKRLFPLLILSFFSKVLQVTAQCTDNQYRRTTTAGVVKCTDCPKCPVGYGLLIQCGSHLKANDRIDCEPCTKGKTFSSNHNFEQCLTCSTCSKDQGMTPCTPHSNVVCHNKCISKENYYEQTSDDCQQCSWCCGDSSDKVQDECLKKGMPKHQSCTVHRKKKCTPKRTSTTAIPSITANETTPVNTMSTIQFLKSTLRPSNPASTTIGFRTGKPKNNKEDKLTSFELVMIFLAVLLLFVVIMACCCIWIRKRKAYKNSANTKDEQPLVTVVGIGTGKMLFDLFRENYELKQKICTKLDYNKSFAAVAHHYEMDEDQIKLLYQVKLEDHPTEQVFDFLGSTYPTLLVTEFISCTDKIKRKDVSLVLEKYK